MHDNQILFGGFQLVRRENVGVLQTDVVSLVEEALSLNPGHVEDVQPGHGLFHGGYLFIGDAPAFQLVLNDVARELQLRGGNENKFDAAVSGHGGDQGVDGAAKFQVSAQADGETLEGMSVLPDCEKVGERLGGMVVASVTGIDDRDSGPAGGHHRRALLGVAHGNDVGIAAHGLDGIGKAFSLGGGGGACLGEAQNLAAQPEHSGLKAQPGPGGGFKEQSSQQFAAAGILVFSGICHDILGGDKQLLNFLFGEVCDVHEIFHVIQPFFDKIKPDF